MIKPGFQVPQRLNRFYDLTHQIHRSIPLSPGYTTMSECPTTGCLNSAVGSYKCVACLTDDLGAHIGSTHAMAYINLLRSQQKLYREMKAISTTKN